MIELRDRELQRTVANTGQVTIGDLKIGVGNIWVGEYTDAQDNTQEGLTTGLWFFIRNREDLDHSVRVYVGQTIEVADYQVRVLDIKSDGPVILGIIPPPNLELDEIQNQSQH
jgi:hypothetical protein